ncbi:lantibiotic dehydratase [Acrocarpospora sp. B8E8]|uniref:lantibiotic dehydratase n=1 Tax=Acrocarpospora sp. B8E8 TaxID=3153572 RepID=UPI00325E7E1C
MTGRLFDVAPVALARIPLLPVPAGQPEPGTGLLLREAVFLASRQAGTSLEESAGGSSRASATLRGYELRARWRPVPNGAFAAAALARIGGKKTMLRLGSGHNARSVPSGAWLASVTGQLAEDPRVLDLAKLTTADLAVRRGFRFEIERPAAPDEAGPQRTSVNATAATELILLSCAGGSDAISLVALAREKWPAASEVMVRAAIVGLVRQGLLLTDLLPADLWDDPVGHLLGRLPPRHPWREGLERLRSLLAEADRYRPGDPFRLAALRAARQTADQICAQQRPLSVNIVADACLELPKSVADAAADAATVLWRIGDRDDPLDGYHRRFVERYGRRRLVSFTELCDPCLGIGPELREEECRRRPAREQALARLIARATTTRAVAVTLDDDDITALTDDLGRPPPRTAEIWARVLAATQTDREEGRFFLAVSGGSQDAGSTAGRFADLRPFLPADPDEEGALVAELVVNARTPQAAALAPPAGLAPRRIPVGVASREGDLRLADLHVFSDGDRLILWSVRQGKPVVPVHYSRLSALMLPPQARLLQLLGRSGCRPFQGWSWGGMQHYPFQPRVLYRRTVLSPARWLLPPQLVAAARERARWPRAVTAWQTETIPSLPSIIVIEDGDRLLPLDLREEDDRELLRRHVGRGTRSVTEQPGGPDAVQAVVAGPDGDHVLELIISLDRRALAPVRQSPASPRPAGAGLHLPGGEWLSLALRAPAHLHDQLVMSLGEAAAAMPGIVSRWFWLRYADTAMGPHLRARFHGDPAVLGGQVLPALSAWCRQAILEQLCGGFSIEPYDQEIERYGGPGAISAAEDAFAADSRLALAVLRTTADPDQRMIAAAHCAATTALTVAANDPAEAIGRPRLDHAARTRYNQLRPQARAAWTTLSKGGQVAHSGPAWCAWLDSLTAYRDSLEDAHRAPCASSLIHMSANRLMEKLADEAIARAMAADLIARRARPQDRA